MKRHKDDLKRKDIYFDEEEAMRHINFIKNIPLVEYEWAGKLIPLQGWQAFFFGSIYGWKWTKTKKRKYTRVYLQVPKKNAKTATAAIASIDNAVVDKKINAQVYFAGYTADTADLCFRAAKNMLTAMQSLYPDTVGKNVKCWTHSIELLNSGTFMKKVSSDAKNLEGKGAKAAVVDEVHTHVNSDVIDNMRSGMALLDDPLLICITTPGFDKESPAYSMYLESENVLDGTISKDSFFPFIWELDEGDDWKDKSLWGKANPNLGASPKMSFLETQFEDALEGGRKEVNFKIKHLGMWVDADVVWITDEIWKRKQPDSMPPLVNRDLAMAIDLASVSDFTSTCFTWSETVNEKKKYYCYWKYYIPEAALDTYKDKNLVLQIKRWVKDGYITLTPGNVTNYHHVKQDILDVAAKNRIFVGNYDPYNSNLLVADLIDKGINMQQFSQQAKTMSPAIKQIETAISNGMIVHANNPVTRWQLKNVRIIEDHNQNFKFSKKNSKGKIDGIVAMAMSVSGDNNHVVKPEPTITIV